MNISQQLFKLGFEISPVILVNGLAAQIPGQMLPIVALTQAADFTLGLLSGGATLPTSLDQYFAHWKPLAGSELLKNTIGQYPFANQATAANSIIAQPLAVSMLMVCPVQQAGGFAAKAATMTVLIQALAMHSNLGGTFTVATPAQIYTNCILLRVADASAGASNQPQWAYQFDFAQPLITINQAAQVYNSLMSKIAGGSPVGLTPSPSGVSSAVGSNVAASTGGATLFPSAANLVGASVSGTTGGIGLNTSGFTL